MIREVSRKLGELGKTYTDKIEAQKGAEERRQRIKFSEESKVAGGRLQKGTGKRKDAERD